MGHLIALADADFGQTAPGERRLGFGGRVTGTSLPNPAELHRRTDLSIAVVRIWRFCSGSVAEELAVFTAAVRSAVEFPSPLRSAVNSDV